MPKWTAEEELAHRFKYHPAESATVAGAHEVIREDAGIFAQSVLQLCPMGRERSAAITKIEEAMFWANAAIARGSAVTDAAERHKAAGR